MLRRQRTLVLVVTEDWYFLSHRLPLALAAKADGMRVVVLTGPGKRGDEISSAGLEHRAFALDRKSVNVSNEGRSIVSLAKAFSDLNPDIVHLVAAKPIVYGNIAATLLRCPRVVSAVAGLGHLYLGGGVGTAAMRLMYETTFRTMVNSRRGRRVIVQNADDATLLVQRRMVQEGQLVLTVGAGVDVAKFRPSAEPDRGPIVILCHSRMLWDKGIGELVAATRELRKDPLVPSFVLRLVGDPDQANPATIPLEQLDDWNREGVAEWLGRRSNIPAELAECHIACLPSYREGAPLSLIEAAASGRPIVTTDVPGCREVVRNGENGLLVPPRQTERLASALRCLITDGSLRRSMGECGRKRAMAEFSTDVINRRVLGCYRELLDATI